MSARIDGRSAHRNVHLRPSRLSARWSGFLSGSRHSRLEQPFAFAEPQHAAATAASVSSALASDAGTVQVVFSMLGPCVGSRSASTRTQDSRAEPAPAVEQVEGVGHISEHCLPACCLVQTLGCAHAQLTWCLYYITARGFVCLLTVCVHRAGKKFFMQPSLTTAAGTPRPYYMQLSTKKYDKGPVLAELCLRLETAITLKLRGVLQDSNPAHQRLLAAEGAWQHAPHEPQCAHSSQLAAAPAVAGVKHEPVSVKAEPASKRARGMQTPVVDLT